MKVLVVDSPIIPFFLKSINQCPDLVLIDSSDGTYNSEQLITAVRIFFPNGNYTISIVKAPTLWFRKSTIQSFLLNFYTFEKEIRKIRRIVRNDSALFYGSRTSSLMLIPSKNQRNLFDHGLGEPIERMTRNIRRFKQFKNYAKRFLSVVFYYFSRPPRARRIYSCFENPGLRHNNGVEPFVLSNYSQITFADIIKPNITKQKKIVLVLFGNTPHTGGVDKFSFSEADMDGNKKLLNRALKLASNDTIIVCKFHPTVEAPNTFFESICNSKDIILDHKKSIFLWNNLVSEQFAMLPVEILWTISHVTHMLCEDSAVGFTMRMSDTQIEFHHSLFQHRAVLGLEKKLKLLDQNLSAGISFL